MGKVTEWTVTTDEDDITRELLLAAKEMLAVLREVADSVELPKELDRKVIRVIDKALG